MQNEACEVRDVIEDAKDLTKVARRILLLVEDVKVADRKRLLAMLQALLGE